MDYMRFGISIDEDIRVLKGMLLDTPTMHVVEVEVLMEVRSSKVVQKVKNTTLNMLISVGNTNSRRKR
jgi:hypothetical protein